MYHRLSLFIRCTVVAWCVLAAVNVSAMSGATSQSGDGSIVVLHAPAGDIGGGGHVVHTGAMIQADVSVGDPTVGGEGLYQDLSVRNLVRGNFVGQLYDLRNLHIPLALPIEVNEGGTLQLDLVKIMDDHTRSRIDLSQVIWETTSGPEVVVDATALATTPMVTEDTLSTIQGSFEERSASINLTILNLMGYPTLIVNISTDENDGVETGGISLREAVAAIDEGGTITFDPGISGQTIPLGGGELAVGRSVTINAADLPKGLTLDGEGSSRVVSVPAGKTVEISHLTITGGQSSTPGGGIHNQGDLTLRNVTVARNASESTGGGIHNAGMLAVHDSTIANNVSASAGGGLRNEANATLTHVTLASNAATSGGGASNDGGSLTLHNTIAGQNQAATSPDVHNLNAGTVTPTGINLIQDLTGSGLNASETVLVGDPKLAPLGGFGGPTQTMHPLSGSDAFEAAGPAAVGAEDQRGFARGRYGDASIGAVDPGTILTVTDPDIGGTNFNLEAAITQAAISGPGTVINFSPSHFPATIFRSTQYVIDSSMPDGLFIDASNIPSGVTIDAGGNSRIFEIDEASSVAMHSLSLTGGAVTGTGEEGTGGAIRSYRSDLTLIACNILGNSARVGGGVRSTTLTFSSGFDTRLAMVGCTVSGNSAEANGGGVSVADVGSRLWMENTTLTANSAGLRGGGLFVFGSEAFANVLHCTITGNQAPSGGGILTRSGGESLVENSIVAGNTATTGPDIAKDTGTVTASATNLIGDHSTVETEFPLGTRVGNTAAPVNPRLAPFANYGGSTQTMPPLPGSPVMEAATLLAGTPTKDQLGNARPNGPLPDIGAVEGFAFSNLALVDTDNDSIDDRLEPSLGLTVGNDDSASDQDGDGQTAAEELAVMTNPLDPNSHFDITTVGQTGVDGGSGDPVFTLTFPCFPGLVYYVEADQNLNFGSPNQKIGPIIPTGYSQTVQMTLMPERDFVRVRTGLRYEQPDY